MPPVHRGLPSWLNSAKAAMPAGSTAAGKPMLTVAAGVVAGVVVVCPNAAVAKRAKTISFFIAGCLSNGVESRWFGISEKRQEILVDVHLDELLRCGLRPVDAGQNATRFENGGDPGGAHHPGFMLSLRHARAQDGHVADEELEQIGDVVANVVFGRPNHRIKLEPIDLGTGRVMAAAEPQSTLPRRTRR